MEEYLSVELHKEYAQRMEDEHRRMNHRLESVEEAVKENQSLTVSVGKLATNMEHMAIEQKKQGDRLEKLEKLPADRWEKVINAIMTAIIGGVVGYIIGVIF